MSVTAEFGKPPGRMPVLQTPPAPFPEKGQAEEEVLAGVRAKLAKNPYPIAQDFGVPYVGLPHPITWKAQDLGRGTFFTQWAEEQQPGTLELERECVRMVGALLGAADPAGFMTS